MSDTLARASGVVFDLDGTLVDTTYVHTICWWQALQQFGHPCSMAQLHRLIGMGADQLLAQVLNRERDPGQDEPIKAAHDALFAAWHERVRPLPGAMSLLSWCRDAGMTVALSSSSGERDLWAMLDVLDHPDFDVVVTGDEVKRSKPFPDLLEMALLRGDLDAEDVLVVGDSVWDFQAAQQINAPSIGLECGGTSAAELQDAGAELVFGDPAALLAALRSARPGVASWS